MSNERTIRTTKAVLELADNGYILHFDDPKIMLVYESDDIPEDMYMEICSDVKEAVVEGNAGKFNITITVEEIYNDTERETSESSPVCS